MTDRLVIALAQLNPTVGAIAAKYFMPNDAWDEATLLALAAKTGDLQDGELRFISGPVRDRRLHGLLNRATLDLATGELKWHVDTGGIETGTAVVANGVAYIGSAPGVADGFLKAEHRSMLGVVTTVDAIFPALAAWQAPPVAKWLLPAAPKP